MDPEPGGYFRGERYQGRGARLGDHGDRQIVPHVGLHFLGEIVERTGPAFEYSAAVPFAAERAPVHDRGRLLAQVAVMLLETGSASQT